MNKVSDFPVVTWFLLLIWNNAADEMWVSRPQVGHQFVQLLLCEEKDFGEKTKKNTSVVHALVLNF